MLPPGREREGDAALLVFGMTFSSFLFWLCGAEGASEKRTDVLGKEPATSLQPERCAGFTFCPVWKPEVISRHKLLFLLPLWTVGCVWCQPPL